MNAAIAFREIDCCGSPGRVSIGAPQPDQNDWRCDYEIDWPGMRRRSYAMGVDSFQALQLAMMKAVVDVAASDDFQAGKLSGFGHPLSSTEKLKEFFGVSCIPGFEQ